MMGSTPTGGGGGSVVYAAPGDIIYNSPSEGASAAADDPAPFLLPIQFTHNLGKTFLLF